MSKAVDMTEAETQAGGGVARWEQTAGAGQTADTATDSTGGGTSIRSPAVSFRRLLASGGLRRALADMQHTIGSVLVIPTFRIIVLQVCKLNARLISCRHPTSVTLQCVIVCRALSVQFLGMQWFSLPCTSSY